ncbi:MAG TPA: hypothetical protein PK530_25405, partial [Anaerolineales bacterium]|nr:hypothetical protein [Anaerolineales bacterium]
MAISNMFGELGGSGLTSYRAGDSGTEVYLPYLTRYDQDRWTWVNVQNTSLTETLILIEYSDGYTRTALVPPGAATTFDQRLEPHLETRFSAKVTSDQPVSAVVVQEGQEKLWSYSGIVSPSISPQVPLIRANDENYLTQIFVQNLGNTPTDITIHYLPAQTGLPCTETQTIPAGDIAIFAEAAFTSGANSDCPAGEAFYGSGVVTENTTDQPLALVVTLFSTENAHADAYTVLNPAEATNSVIIPLLLNSCGGQYTFFGIQNVGTQTTTVSCVEVGGEYSVTEILAPGTSVITSQQGMLACPFPGPAFCTATGGDAL